MHYVMSDIHGEFEKYVAMLELISFSNKDTLYVIGDVIDRASNGVSIIEDIMLRDNIIMLKGNHEQMCIDTFDGKFGARYQWQYNGGSSTYRELKYKRTSNERRDILSFLKSLPDNLTVNVDGRCYYLVHGWPGDNRDDRLWGRPNHNAKQPIPNCTTIVGHTPVIFFYSEDEVSAKKYATKLRKEHSHYKIFHANFIGIDCGCGNRTDLRRLACMRLEDGAEFYV